MPVGVGTFGLLVQTRRKNDLEAGLLPNFRR